MSENFPNIAERYPEPALATPESVGAYFYDWYHNPTGGDEMIANFGLEAAKRMRTDMCFKGMIEEMIHDRRRFKKPDDPHLDADYARNLILREFQLQFIWLDAMTNPAKTSTPLAGYDTFIYPSESLKTQAGMSYAVERVLADCRDFLRLPLAHEKIVSNVSDRYKATKIVLPRIAYRYGGKPLTVIDVGPSIGLGPKKLLLNEPFSPIEKAWMAGIEGIENVQDLPKPTGQDQQDLITQAVNRSIAQPLNMGRIIGFENHVSQSQVHRVKAHSFYLGEYFEYCQPHDEPNRLDEFNRLAEQDIDGYEQFRGDFTSTEDVDKFLQQSPGFEADFISMYTVAYMWSEKELAVALANAKRLLSNKGVLLIADRATIDPGNPNGIRLGGKWSDEWVYSGIIFDKAEGWQPKEWLRWRTPRCRELLLDFREH